MSLADLEKHVGSQGHLLQFWNDLDEVQREVLSKQLLSVNFDEAAESFRTSENIYVANPDNLTPIPNDRCGICKELDDVTRKGYWQKGLEAISRGEVAVIVLAGGQASRLGSSSPKGVINLGIDVSPEGSLLSIQACKIARLQSLARKQYPEGNNTIQWLVMTSKTTEEPTREHLNTVVPAAGLSMEQVTIFSQDNIPAFDLEGKLLLSSKNLIVTAPNGNGGIYSALADHLPSLETKGVKMFHVYCVDNILCKVADPYFLGFALSKNADVAAKTVEKRVGELVGSVCLDNGKPRVTEYSELGAELAEKKTSDGRFLFGAGSIANHYFTLDFLKSFCSPSYRLPFHRALKKIASISPDGVLITPEKPNGIKLEQFIFDVFYLSKNFYIWQVEREDEFSPLKNAETAGVDCLSTCLRDLSAQSCRWLEKAGATVGLEGNVYVKPLKSFDGEGLGEFSNTVIDKNIVG